MNSITRVLRNLPDIVSGWFNAYFGSARAREISRKRTEICRTNTCGYYDKDGSSEIAYIKGEETCGGCGCPLKSKTASMDSFCYLKEIGLTPLWNKE